MKSSRKFSLDQFGLIFLTFICLLGFVGCQQGAQLIQETEDVSRVMVEENEKGEETIRFLYSHWPPDLMAYLAQEKGFFEKYNVSVELVPVSGYSETLEKKASEEVSYVWAFTLLDAVKEYALEEEPTSQIFLLQDYSIGADAVLAKADSGISDIAGLKGKKVGLELGTVGEFFLNILLKREGLTLNDLEIVNMASEEIPNALAEGKIEAGVAYEPNVSIALNRGAVLITDSRREQGVIVDVYVGKRDHIQANQEAYQNFSKAIFEAVDYFSNNPEESIQIMVHAFNMDPQELKRAFGNLDIANLLDNEIAFSRGFGFSSLYNLTKFAGQHLEEQGLIKGVFDFDQLLNPTLIQAIGRQN